MVAGAHQLVAPNVAQELLLGKDPSGLSGEDAKERELLRREIDRALAEHYVARDRIDRELADLEEAARAALARAPQHGADSGGELPVVEGLADVVVQG